MQLMEHQKLENKHQTTAGAYIADFIYGANDGLITTFAIISASAGAEISAGVIIILGLANLFADGFSMATSNYLGIRSRRNFELDQKRIETAEIEDHPEEEKKEIREIYEKKGFQGADLERVVEVISSDKKVWVNEMLIGELSIIPEEDIKSTPFRHAITTFFAFAVIGFIPLAPFILGYSGKMPFYWSVCLTALMLFLVGGSRTKVTGGGFIKNGLQMLLFGGCAAVIAYLIGFLVHQFTGISV